MPSPAENGLLLGRLGPAAAPVWSRIRLPVPSPQAPVRVISIPDDSGRVLLTVSGRTFLYRVR